MRPCAKSETIVTSDLAFFLINDLNVLFSYAERGLSL